MLSRRIAAGTLVAGSVALALATAGPALADPSTVTVRNGTQTTGTVNFTATNTTPFSLYDIRSTASFTCPIGAVNITGTTTAGTHSNAPAATITGITFPSPATASNVCKFSGLPVSPINAKTEPTTPGSPLATGGTSTLPWGVVANYNSSPSGTPASGQETDGSITGVRLQAVLNTAVNGVQTPNCGIDFGDGLGGNGTIAGNGPGTANRVFFKNGNPSTLSLLSNKTGTVKLGINELYNPTNASTKISTQASVGNGCAGGTLKAKDTAFVYGANTTSPALFSINPTANGPLWIAAP